MRAVLVLLLLCVSAWAVSAASVELTDMEDDMPLMSESVFAAAEDSSLDEQVHSEDEAFFLQLSEHVEDAAELEAAAEHDADSESEWAVVNDFAVDSEADQSTDAAAENALEVTIATEADADADHNPNALYRPALRPDNRVQQHGSQVAQIRDLFGDVTKHMPASAKVGDTFMERYTDHVF
jgi:hypothetical protein